MGATVLAARFNGETTPQLAIDAVHEITDFDSETRCQPDQYPDSWISLPPLNSPNIGER